MSVEYKRCPQWDYNFLNDKFDRNGKNSYLIKVAKIELKLS